MKIILTGGGTGGHFYPLIAVAEEINKIVRDNKLLAPKLYYLSNEPYDKRLLFENGIVFKKIYAGKIRRYFSILNFFGLFKTAFGFIKSFYLVFSIFPDVIFSNGGYVSFPVLLSAKIFKIPVVIHISDSIPGKTNLWAAKFAQKVSIAFEGAANYLPKIKDKLALFGNPIQKNLLTLQREGAGEFLHLEHNIPTILILGGSSGSQIINENLIDILPELTQKYQIIHQTGKALFENAKNRAMVVLEKSEHKSRYHSFPYLNTLAMRMSAGIADLVVSRAGAGSISEIATSGKVSIIIPIPESVSGDQRKNAFAYTRAGACVVIEQHNLSPQLFLAEINKLMSDLPKRKDLEQKAKIFARTDAAEKIANGIINIALGHVE